MKSRIIIFSILFLLFSFGDIGKITAQIKKRQDKQLILKADKAFDFGDYFGALKMYESLYLLDSTDTETNFKLGVCSFEIKKSRANAKKYLNKVPLAEFPEVAYYLGRLNHLSKDFDKATYYYNQYKYFGAENEHSGKEVDDLIEKCNTAKSFEANSDKSIVIKNIGNTINSEHAEYVPLIPADESFMVFTSRRNNPIWKKMDPLGDFYEDIYVSKKDNSGNWSAPVILDTTINTAVHDACTGLSADGEKLLLYRTSKDMKSGDIYESFYKDQKWSKPEILSDVVNSPEYLETSACYSPNGDIIFFSSNRPGGFGGKDLYLSRKLQNGKWGKPFNLGPTINTEYDEDAPFVHPLGNILYFSSEGHTNMGGYDIFKSTFDEAGKFSEAKNLGSPINTVDDDIFFVMNTDASKGYLSSDREGGFGLQDIYSVTFPANNLPLNVYNIHVVDAAENIVNDVELRVTDVQKKLLIGVYKSNNKTGKVLVIAVPKKEYEISITADGYEPFETKVELDKIVDLSFKIGNKTK